MFNDSKPLKEGYYKKDGIIYGPDDKPCRQCNSLRDLMSLSSGDSSSSPFATRKRPTIESKVEESPIEEGSCPPDVEQLGRSTWTFLHTMAANYPARATPVQQNDMSSFLRTFSMFYPCWVCAEDLREWMAKKENEPVLDQGWAGLGQWMCRAHNEVNQKLGKEQFNCKLWRQRWKDGWKDGSCDP